MNKRKLTKINAHFYQLNISKTYENRVKALFIVFWEQYFTFSAERFKEKISDSPNYHFWVL
jgi:hypothetical protein